jgi:hypothetical protein
VVELLVRELRVHLRLRLVPACLEATPRVLPQFNSWARFLIAFALARSASVGAAPSGCSVFGVAAPCRLWIGGCFALAPITGRPCEQLHRRSPVGQELRFPVRLRFRLERFLYSLQVRFHLRFQQGSCWFVSNSAFRFFNGCSSFSAVSARFMILLTSAKTLSSEASADSPSLIATFFILLLLDYCRVRLGRTRALAKFFSGS